VKVKLTKNSPEILESWRKPVIQVVGMTCIRLMAPFSTRLAICRRFRRASPCVSTSPAHRNYWTPRSKTLRGLNGLIAHSMCGSLGMRRIVQKQGRCKDCHDARHRPRDRKVCHCARGREGEALTRRPDGRPRPPSRSTAARTLARTMKWSCTDGTKE